MKSFFKGFKEIFLDLFNEGDGDMELAGHIVGFAVIVAGFISAVGGIVYAWVSITS